MKSILSTVLILISAIYCAGQIVIPSASPLAIVNQKVGVTDIKVTYSRPSVKERNIFSNDGLVPFGEYWRTGANSPTSIEVSEDITIGGHILTKGEYIILTKPHETAWHVNIYEKESGGWSKYIDRKPVMTFSTLAANSQLKMESLLIYFDNIKMASAEIVIHWDKSMVRIPFEVEVHEKVMSSIAKAMNGQPSDFDYFRAASYLYSVDQDLNKALAYIQIASHGENPTFFFLRREATILAKLGRYQEAIHAAEQSTDLAEKVENIDVIKLNDKSILEWKEMLL